MSDKLFFLSDMNQKLQSLLTLLKTFSHPVAISELSEKLNKSEENLSDRTIRRYLQQLIKLGLVESQGKNKGVRYFPVIMEENRQVNNLDNNDSSFIFSSENQIIIDQIRQPLIKRELCTYNIDWLDSYQPNQTYYLSVKQRQVLHKHGKPLIDELPAGTYARKIFNHLLINLSYNSARLEGNTYSIIDTEKLLLEGKTAANKLDMETIMILNHKEAIRFLVDGINRMEINIDNIRSLHYLLADGLIQPEDAGQIREMGVRISLSTYIPLEGKARITTQLNHIVSKARQIQEPYEQSFFLLVHLSYLQSFIDVNKRTARLTANIPLVRHNLVPVSFNDITIDDYNSAVISCYELNRIEPLAQLYVWSYQRSCKHYKTRAQSLGIDTLRVKYRQQRRQLIADIVTKQLYDSAQDEYINDYLKENVAKNDQKKFLLDLQHDLNTLDSYNIIGMGITKKELKQWKKANKSF
jgi:Fic family protein